MPLEASHTQGAWLSGVGIGCGVGGSGWADQKSSWSLGQKGGRGCGCQRGGSVLPFTWIRMEGGAVERLPLWLLHWLLAMVWCGDIVVPEGPPPPCGYRAVGEGSWLSTISVLACSRLMPLGLTRTAWVPRPCLQGSVASHGTESGHDGSAWRAHGCSIRFGPHTQNGPVSVPGPTHRPQVLSLQRQSSQGVRAGEGRSSPETGVPQSWAPTTPGQWCPQLLASLKAWPGIKALGPPLSLHHAPAGAWAWRCRKGWY